MSFRFFPVFVLLRETERLWENWLVAKTTHTWCNEKEGLADNRWHRMRCTRDESTVSRDEMRSAEFTSCSNQRWCNLQDKQNLRVIGLLQ